MIKDIAFKNMAASDFVKTYAIDKLEPVVRKHLRQPQQLLLRFSVEHDENIIHCGVVGEHHIRVDLDQRGPDMYAAIDGLADRLGEALRRQHDRKIKVDHAIPIPPESPSASDQEVFEYMERTIEAI